MCHGASTGLRGRQAVWQTGEQPVLLRGVCPEAAAAERLGLNWTVLSTSHLTEVSVSQARTKTAEGAPSCWQPSHCKVHTVQTHSANQSARPRTTVSIIWSSFVYFFLPISHLKSQYSDNDCTHYYIFFLSASCAAHCLPKKDVIFIHLWLNIHYLCKHLITVHVLMSPHSLKHSFVYVTDVFACIISFLSFLSSHLIFFSVVILSWVYWYFEISKCLLS